MGRWRRAAGMAVGLMMMTETAQGLDAQGHRGARGLLPENTLAGFTRALDIGVTTLELDTGLSRDGVVMVVHNPSLEPVNVRDRAGNWLDATGPAIHDLGLVELRTFDVGGLNPDTRYAARYPDQETIAGARIPTLDEVFKLVAARGDARVRFNIEIKIEPRDPDRFAPLDAFAAAVLKVIDDHGVANRVTIQSFDWRALKEIHRQAPGMRTSFLTVQQPWFNNLNGTAWTAGFDLDDFDGNVPRMVKAAGGHWTKPLVL